MALGDIGTVIDSLEFDTGTCRYPHIIHISGDVFAVAYEGVDGDGWLATFTIDTAGQIGAAVIDTLEFDAVAASYPRIIHVSGTTYAIVYVSSGVNPPTKIVTMDITTAGQIGAAVIDTFSSTSVLTIFPDIIHISGDYYAVAHSISGVGSDPDTVEIFTVTIDSAGNIGASEVSTYSFQVSSGWGYPVLIPISGTTYAIVYTGSDGNGYVSTLTISNVGVITQSLVDTLQLDSSAAFAAPRIIQVSGAVYAIVFTGAGGDGFVVTVTINSDGTIDDAIISTLEFDTADGDDCSIVKIGSSSLFAIAYRGVDNDGFLKTMNIASDGTIGSVLDTLEFDTADGWTPSAVLVPNTTIVAIAYWGVDNDGWVKTAGVNLAGELSGVITIKGTAFRYVDGFGKQRGATLPLIV